MFPRRSYPCKLDTFEKVDNMLVTINAEPGTNEPLAKVVMSHIGIIR